MNNDKHTHTRLDDQLLSSIEVLSLNQPNEEIDEEEDFYRM